MHSKFQTKFKSECVCLFLQLLGDTLARETKRHWEEPAVEIAKKTRIKKLKFSNLKGKMKIEIEIEKKKKKIQTRLSALMWGLVSALAADDETRKQPWFKQINRIKVKRNWNLRVKKWKLIL